MTAARAMRRATEMALASLAAACTGAGSPTATPSVDVATSDLVPWVAAESDGKTTLVYVGFRSSTSQPVGLAGDDVLAATIGSTTVTLTTFAQFAGTPFKTSPMLRDLSTGLSNGVYYSASVPVTDTEPTDIRVELRRAAARGGPAEVARVRLAAPQTIAAPVPSTVAHGTKVDVCWDTAPHVGPSPDVMNELGTYGLCTFGTTTFSSTANGKPSGCLGLDTAKIKVNDIAGCELTVYARAESSGVYSSLFHTGPASTDGGKPLPPDSVAPVAWQYSLTRTTLTP